MKRIQILLIACAITIGAQSAVYAWQVPGLETAKKYAKPAAKVAGAGATTFSALMSTLICAGVAYLSYKCIQVAKDEPELSKAITRLNIILFAGSLGAIASLGTSILGIVLTDRGLKDAYRVFMQSAQQNVINPQDQQQ